MAPIRDAVGNHRRENTKMGQLVHNRIRLDKTYSINKFDKT